MTSRSRSILVASVAVLTTFVCLHFEESLRAREVRGDPGPRLGSEDGLVVQKDPEVIWVNGLRMRPFEDQSDTPGRETVSREVSSSVDPFPVEGDAPGADDPLLPRPPGSRRVLRAHVEGDKDYVSVYSTAESEQRVREETVRKLEGLGWQLVGQSRDQMSWTRENLDAVITIRKADDGNTHFVVFSSARESRS